jgi:hypothetical protein
MRSKARMGTRIICHTPHFKKMAGTWIPPHPLAQSCCNCGATVCLGITSQPWDTQMVHFPQDVEWAPWIPHAWLQHCQTCSFFTQTQPHIPNSYMRGILSHTKLSNVP